jgi:type VI secretion system protein ImpF
MVELSLRERLQPSLLDRLVDDERLLTLFELTVPRDELQRLNLSERELSEILKGQGLRPAGAEGVLPVREESQDLLRWRLVAPPGRVSLAQLKSLMIKPPAAPQGVTLQSVCRIEARNVPNTTAESPERRFLSMRKLREYVCRDLAALLNSMSLEQAVDLARYPQVATSVLNFGMRSLAGRTAASVDALQTAASIEQVIRRFEPRLTHVHVTLDAGRDGAVEGHQLAFRIEAQLWGQPAPQNLVLRTQIDVDTGDVSVTDTGV